MKRLAAEEKAAKEKAQRDADPRRQHCITDAQATKLAVLDAMESAHPTPDTYGQSVERVPLYALRF